MISRTSADWTGIKRWLHEKRAEKLTALAAPTCMTKDGEHYRGMIMFIDEIIETVEPQLTDTAAPAAAPGAGY